MIKNIGHIKSFLKHKNPSELTKLMLKNNVKTGCYHDYVIVFAEGLWYAWYEIDLNDIIQENTDDIRGSKG